jgi:lon-related putative ATP-dependent protease
LQLSAAIRTLETKHRHYFTTFNEMAKKKKLKQASIPARRVRTTHPLEVTVDKLRWHCHPDLLNGLESVEPITEIIGQDRALRSLRVGLEMMHHGYNIFVTGLSGTGRTTTVKRLLHEYEAASAELTDKCYVHNFRDPDSPVMIGLPAGQGITFKKDMAGFVNELLKSVPAAFESRRYQEQRKAMLEHFQDRQRSVLKDFEKRVKERGFEVVQVQSGPGMRPEIAPSRDGSPLSLDQLHAKLDAGEMTQQEFNSILTEQAELEGQMDLVMREMRNIERKAKKSLEDLGHKIVVPIVEELLYDLEEKYPAPRVREYLNEVKKEVITNVGRFHQKEDQQQSVLGIAIQREEDVFLEYQVNVIVDNAAVKGRPMVIETNPRYKNLFGTIERVVDRNGVWRTDFTHIKAGSLLKADGGFLVINALDALVEPGVWTTLKRVLRNRLLEIQPLESGLFGGSSALKPEPIELNVKVIMVGDAYIYHLLYAMDEDFKKIFKIKADFDTVMPNDGKSIRSYLAFIKTITEQDKLRPTDVGGVAEIVEYGIRLSGRQNKLSTRFSILADLLREANYWAWKENAERITGKHVRRAIDEGIERVRMVEEKIQELIDDGTIMIDTEGSVVGQVNGLSVYDVGEYAFGRPTRITAKTAIGRTGIINIEREADLSGPTHNKGMLILTGYLRSKYAQNKPLVLSASIAFEQSYSGVDGDSASSTEVYALLSSLAEVPLRQDLAVTGSVNQHGEIQAIGGVNLKIEGFFDVCKARGLTGTQGVLIPHQNIKDLMLRHDVVEAVKRKQFHIYPVRTIDEGIELLTGIPAGGKSKSGRFTPGSINARVDAKLTSYVKKQKKMGG